MWAFSLSSREQDDEISSLKAQKRKALTENEALRGQLQQHFNHFYYIMILIECPRQCCVHYLCNGVCEGCALLIPYLGIVSENKITVLAGQ